VYIHCKSGFFEVDRWDGTPFESASHQKEVDKLRDGGDEIVVVRTRRWEALVELLERYTQVKRRIWESPAGWDYQFRAYLTRCEWAATMSRIAMDLDYRNFKSWITKNGREQHDLALRIWQAAHDTVSAGRYVRRRGEST
jgi:hypothetical protein